MGGFFTKSVPVPEPKPHIYNKFKQLRDLCKNESEHEEVCKHTCALVKKIEQDFQQPSVWTNTIGPRMISFEIHIEGENYIGGEDSDFLWHNEKFLLDKWNMDIASHTVHYGQAGGDSEIAWEWSVHRFFFRLQNDFFNDI